MKKFISILLSLVFLTACGGNKISPEEKLITDLISRWAAPQSEEIVADFYDGWDVIGDNSDSTSASEDTDNALDTAYREYFTEEGWTYFQSFMLPITIAATENDFTISAENLAVEELADGYDVTFDLKHYKGEDKTNEIKLDSAFIKL